MHRVQSISYGGTTDSVDVRVEGFLITIPPKRMAVYGLVSHSWLTIHDPKFRKAVAVLDTPLLDHIIYIVQIYGGNIKT